MRRSGSIAALASVLVLAGCVGIPTSGGVVTGGIIDEQVDPDVVVLPDAPRPGSSQEEILEDFLLALRGPQSSYAIARQYLADSFAEVWNPDESAIIRTGIPVTSPGVAPDTLLYTITSTAIVDSAGIYSEPPPAQQTFQYTFVQENGEWRISDAPNGIILSQSSFDVVFTQQALYFFDPSYQYLVPDVRWFPARATVTTRIVRELLAGPAPWLQPGAVVSAFPVATTVEGAQIASGTAVVDLSVEALTAPPTDRDRMRQQLAASLDVGSVAITVGGSLMELPPAGAGAIRNPSVEPAVLVGAEGAFGFETTAGIAEVAGISEQVVASGATAATLSNDKQVAALLTPAGVQVARSSVEGPLVVDSRPGLVAPSLDPFRFVWSVPADDPTALRVFETDGTQHIVASGLPSTARVASIAVSRDGTRLLVYLDTPEGARLQVAGIIRQADNVPIELGTLVDLPVSSATPVAAAWVSDRVVATVARGAEAYPVTLVEIGGPGSPLSQVPDAVAITGGNGGADGVRVLAADGTIWQPRGSGGWVSTGLTATFLATRQ